MMMRPTMCTEYKSDDGDDVVERRCKKHTKGHPMTINNKRQINNDNNECNDDFDRRWLIRPGDGSERWDAREPLAHHLLQLYLYIATNTNQHS